MVKNKYDVGERQWKKWTPHARRVFNYMYECVANQRIMKHPLASIDTEIIWSTTRWNAAWLAAEATDRA